MIMKVVHVLAGKANPETMNGVNKVVHHLSEEQTNNGLDVEVWGLTKSSLTSVHSHNYKLKLFSMMRTRFSISPELTAEIEASNADIVHFHSVFIPEFFVIAKLLSKNKTPWVITPHSGYSTESIAHNYLLKVMYFRVFEKYLIKNSRAIHLLGIREKGLLSKHCDDNKFVIIPNGHNVCELVDHIEKRSELPLFGFCGRLSIRHKGLDLLCLGFAEYVQSGGKGNLRIIGGGEVEQLKAIINELGLESRIDVMGPLFGTKKVESIRHMDAFIHTSRWEGIPMAVLEAASMKIPVLITEETNLGSYVRRHNAGYVLKDNSAHNISDALHKLEDDFVHKRIYPMGENAKSMIINDFSWSFVEAQVRHDLYNLGDSS
ncbi:MAG TPA: glycosyltransferase [Chromatiales bacterium]|nr:glycosyltransferase [Chromatiales bacterium]